MGWKRAKIVIAKVPPPARGRKVQKVEAAAFAAKILPIIEALRSSGLRDLRGLAASLNNRGVGLRGAVGGTCRT